MRDSNTVRLKSGLFVSADSEAVRSEDSEDTDLVASSVEFKAVATAVPASKVSQSKSRRSHGAEAQT